MPPEFIYQDEHFEASRRRVLLIYYIINKMDDKTTYRSESDI